MFCLEKYLQQASTQAKSISLKRKNKKVSKMYKIIFLSLFLMSTTNIDAYRILAVFPQKLKSHNVMFDVLMKGLAKHNHQVDLITFFPNKNVLKNYKTIINLNETKKSTYNSLTVATANNKDLWLNTVYKGNNVCELLGYHKLQSLLKNPPIDPPYDVVITEVNCIKKL